MSRWRLEHGYDGGGFSGWAAQPGMRTVQGELEGALAVLMRREVNLTVAGRTDAGVHAVRQVATFDATEKEVDEFGGADALRQSLNALTGWDLAVWSVRPAPPDFDARRSALSRTYVYRIDPGRPPSPFERGRAFWWPRPIDRTALDRCAAAAVGTHDFTAFTPTKTQHVHFRREVIRAEWEQDHRSAGRELLFDRASASPLLAFRIEADAFMRTMVRILVGTMLEVAGGGRTVAEFARLLDGGHRSDAGPTAPAHGLYLEEIRYRGAES